MGYFGDEEGEAVEATEVDSTIDNDSPAEGAESLDDTGTPAEGAEVGGEVTPPAVAQEAATDGTFDRSYTYARKRLGHNAQRHSLLFHHGTIPAGV